MKMIVSTILVFFTTTAAYAFDNSSLQEVIDQHKKEDVISALVETLKVPSTGGIVDFSSCFRHDNPGMQKNVGFSVIFATMRNGKLYVNKNSAQPTIYATQTVAQENYLWPVGSSVETTVRLRADQKSISQIDFIVNKPYLVNLSTVANPDWKMQQQKSLSESFTCLDQK